MRLADAGFALEPDRSPRSGHDRGNEALQDSKLVDVSDRSGSGTARRRAGNLPELPRLGEPLESMASTINEDRCRKDPGQLSHHICDEDLTAGGTPRSVPRH